MHLFFFPYGHEHQVQIMFEKMRHSYWQWTRTDLKTNKEETILVAGQLRHSYGGAFEYVFPEPCLAEVLAFLGVPHDGAHHKGEASRLWCMRRVFNLKRIPKETWDIVKNISSDISVGGDCTMDRSGKLHSLRGLSSAKTVGAGITVLGIKYDRHGPIDFGPAGYFDQEWL